jgi:drug/metabolite transporter (DMT)-like permease
VWGVGYIATKIGLQHAPPFTFLALRFAFGLLCLAPVVLSCACAGPGRRRNGGTSRSPGS